MELASIITTNRETTEVVTNKYQMQDISNMSHGDINPRPSLDTHFIIAVDRMLSKPIDTTNNDTPKKRGDNHTGLRMLRFIINEPGPNRVYHHIMREILNIIPGGILDKLIVHVYVGVRTPSVKNNLNNNDDNNDNYDCICSLEEDGIIDVDQLDELSSIDSYLNYMQNRSGPISDGYADITKCTRDDFVAFTKRTHAMDRVYDEEEARGV